MNSALEENHMHGKMWRPGIILMAAVIEGGGGGYIVVQ